MTQKEMALVVTDDVFKANIGEIFKVLGDSFTTATNAADKQTAVDRAKKGLAWAQETRTQCLTLANTLQQ